MRCVLTCKAKSTILWPAFSLDGIAQMAPSCSSCEALAGVLAWLGVILLQVGLSGLVLVVAGTVNNYRPVEGVALSWRPTWT
jgi:hypothetical protein